MATRWFILLAVILSALDQYSKFLARKLVPFEDLEPLINGNIGAVHNWIWPDFYALTLNFNKGIAWGMLPMFSEQFKFFAIIMVLVILLILKKLDRDEVWLKIALAFQMAGAIGNMTDRIIIKRVTDFIQVVLFPNADVHYSWQIFGKTVNFDLPYAWPIFNLADSFIVVGTIVLVLVLLLTRDMPLEDKVKKKEPAVAGISGDSLIPESDSAEGLCFEPGEDERVEMECLPGAIPTEEALKEIPDPEEESLLQEFDETTQREILQEPLGRSQHEYGYPDKKSENESKPEADDPEDRYFGLED